MNQIDIPDYQYHLDCNAKRMVRVTFLEKNLYFIRKCRFIRLSFAYSIFKSIEILSGQEVVQIKPNSASRIPCVIKA